MRARAPTPCKLTNTSIRENKHIYIYCLSKIQTESYVKHIYVGPVQKGEHIMCAPSKDRALHQHGCFDRAETCFGAVGNMPCPTIHHGLLEYLLLKVIFKVSINRNERREIGASATPNMMSSHRAGTDPPSSMQPQRRPRGRPKKKRAARK